MKKFDEWNEIKKDIHSEKTIYSLNLFSSKNVSS